jgi:hypothetical protein
VANSQRAIPAREFRPGALVRFLPQPGAYSIGCAQHWATGRVGMVVALCHWDYCAVTFGNGEAILCPTYYLEDAV